MSHLAHQTFGDVAAAITHLIAFEVGNEVQRLSLFAPVANPWRWACIHDPDGSDYYVAPEVLIDMKPRANANENSARKPFRPKVP